MPTFLQEYICPHTSVAMVAPTNCRIQVFAYDAGIPILAGNGR